MDSELHVWYFGNYWMPAMVSLAHAWRELRTSGTRFGGLRHRQRAIFTGHPLQSTYLRAQVLSNGVNLKSPQTSGSKRLTVIFGTQISWSFIGYKFPFLLGWEPRTTIFSPPSPRSPICNSEARYCFKDSWDPCRIFVPLAAFDIYIVQNP